MNILIIEREADNITILLEWTPENGVIYNVSADAAEPKIEIITMRHSSARLTVSYNIHYNVSIIASTCGLNSTVTIVKLHYGELKSCTIPILYE